MLAPYSRPVGGFVTLFPVMEVGNTLRQALYLTGVLMAAPRVCKAFGLIVSANGKSHGIRLVTESISGARREAVKHSINGPVVLCMGASMGGKGGPIFRRLEQIEVMSPVQAVEHDDASIVASNGRLAEKAVNPRNYRDLEAISAKLARQLSAADRAWAQSFLKRYMNTFDVNWSKLTPTQFNTVFRESRKFLSSLSTKGLLPVWDKHVTASVHGTALATRKILKREFFPKIGIAFSLPDKRALDQIAAQQGWFLRDEFGRRADALTAKGREIVQHGLRQGVGRDVIAQDLRKGLPGLWNAYGKNYSRAVASVAVNRARSFSEIKSYVSAGVHSLEVQAVLDERTTEICRGMDGQIIDVHLANTQVDAAANVGTPEGIATTSPFMRVNTNARTGVRSIVTTNGARIADVMRSGVGRLDDRGQMSFNRMGNQLPEVGIGPPPYHHL